MVGQKNKGDTSFGVDPAIWATNYNLKANGGLPTEYYDWDIYVNKEQFLKIPWDAVIISRIESEQIMKELLAQHPNHKDIKVIAQAGNENIKYDWNFAPNLLSSDWFTYKNSTALNKLWYMQEVGQQFRDFSYPTQKIVGTYVNCLKSFTNCSYSDATHYNSKCPHCIEPGGHQYTYNLYEMWTQLKDKCIGRVELRDYGIGNEHGMMEQKILPLKMKDTCLTIGGKPYDGFGHSLAQSVSLGRMVIVPEGFFKYRTGCKFLIEDRTCFSVPWTSEEIATKINWFVSDWKRVQDYSLGCYEAAQACFNWVLEAKRIKEFMEKLI